MGRLISSQRLIGLVLAILSRDIAVTRVRQLIQYVGRPPHESGEA